MQIALHKNARTTPVVRALIAASDETDSVLVVNRQEVICRFEPGHRGDITDAAVRPVPVIVMQLARQGIGSFGLVLVRPAISPLM